MAVQPQTADPDPYAIITVDTAKYPKDVAEALWLQFDGPCGECGGTVQMSIGCFLDILEAQGCITPAGESTEQAIRRIHRVSGGDCIL